MPGRRSESHLIEQDELGAHEGVEDGEDGQGQGDVQEEGRSHGEGVQEEEPPNRLHPRARSAVTGGLKSQIGSDRWPSWVRKGGAHFTNFSVRYTWEESRVIPLLKFFIEIF